MFAGGFAHHKIETSSRAMPTVRLNWNGSPPGVEYARWILSEQM
jgi:hypothetical protein